MTDRDPARGPTRDPTIEQLAEATRGNRRREPRYRAFLLTGALAGLLVAVVLTLLAPAAGQGSDAAYSSGAVFGYLAASCGLVGGLLGGLAAVLAARRR